MSHAQQLQLALFDEVPSVDVLISRREDQWFDRKSINIKTEKLIECLVGMANADGGRVVIGIKNGEIEGINSHMEQVNG